MRFSSLRAFRYVMESGTIAAAATRLNLSQPAVSRLISGLEDELSVQFFVRQGRRLSPTLEGLRFFEETQGLLAAIDHLPLTASEIKENAKRRVRVVCMPRLAFSVALPAIAMVQSRDPGIQCELVVQDRVEMEREAVSHSFDIGLAVLPVDTHAVNVMRLGTSPVYVLAHRDHYLSGRRKIDFSQIIDEPIIALPDGTRDRGEMDGLFRSHSAKPRIGSVVPTIEAAATLAAAGVGITFADELSIASLSHLGLATIAMTPTWHLAFGLFQPAHRRLSPVVSELIVAVEQRLEEIRAPFHSISSGSTSSSEPAAGRHRVPSPGSSIPSD
ncbi:MAG: LysR family transcriptional regulator [Hyphomicrobiales bacterium]|nr:LysR family transcriptional regulator [Hyphomicrobiales bacterium]